MNEVIVEKKMIVQLYSDLKKFMIQNKIDYKMPSEGGVDFSKSDIDILLRRHEDLKKIKLFICNYGIKVIVRTDNKNQFYFIVIDEQLVHAFDFTVGLISNTGVICNGDYLFQSSENGVNFKENYKFLKNSVKYEHSFYVIKQNKKSIYLGSLLFIKKTFKYLRNVFSKNTTGISLVLLGVDGSGKSTASDFIQSSLSVDRKLFQLKTIYFKPNVFKIKPDRKFSTSDNIPHSHSSYSSCLSICKVLYVFLNYIFYWPLLYIRKKNGHLIVFDRHFYDMLIDSKRYRINHSGVWVAKLLSGFIPKPNVVIILTSDVSELAVRKPGEVPKDLLSILNVNYQNFSLKNVNICRITNNGSIKELKEGLLDIVLKEF